MNEENSVDEVLDEKSQQENQDTGFNRVKQQVEEEAKKQSKKATKEVKQAVETAKVNKTAVSIKAAGGISIGGILYYILGAVIVIVMVVGIISFIINMPGNVVDNIYEAVGAIIDYLNGNDDESVSSQINKDLLVDKLNYLDEMGMDPVGFGLVAGVTRGGEDNKITDFWTYENSPNYLYYYIFSDIRSYVIIRNNIDTVLEEGPRLFWDYIWGEESTFADVVGQGMLYFYRF